MPYGITVHSVTCHPTQMNAMCHLHFQLTSDMAELYKIITRKQDSDVTSKFNTIPVAFTRGNTYKIRPCEV